MRVVAAGYPTALATPGARPLWRVRLANHGGVFADPLDVTDHVLSVEVTRPLRDGNSATIVLVSETGQYDPLYGLYALAVKTANAEVQIDMGEVLAGVPTYARVMTGRILSCLPRYDVGTGGVELEVVDRVTNPWQYRVTSPYYDLTGATPAFWTAHQIIQDLFERYYNFTWPGDFNLDVAGDWTLLGPAQFTDESVAVMANKLLQPKGYRFFFDYDGDASSAALIPAGPAAGWPILGTVLAHNVERVTGPQDVQPDATRIRILGGGTDHDMVAIGDHSVLATGNYDVGFGGSTRGDRSNIGGSDVYYWVKVTNQWYELWLQAAQKEIWRAYVSHVGPIRYQIGDDTVATWAIAPHVHHVGASDSYHGGMDRHVANVGLQMALAVAEVVCEMDVLGHKFEVCRPQVFVQRWDDTLIATWGEIPRDIENPLVQHWNQAVVVGDQELVLAQLSGRPVTVDLKRLDLRIESGDVWTIENPHGTDFPMWVRTVNHGAGGSNASTSFEGYVLV